MVVPYSIANSTNWKRVLWLYSEQNILQGFTIFTKKIKDVVRSRRNPELEFIEVAVQ
jgi:hypothetical protein